MPKKTKKQKVHAKHRIIQPNSTSLHQERSTTNHTDHSGASKQTGATVQPAGATHEMIFKESSADQSYFKHDLAKTLMITLLIICAQVALYILQISGTIDVGNLISF